MKTATLRNLQSGLNRVSGIRQEIEKTDQPTAAPTAQARPDRAGKTLIGGWFPRSFSSSLRLIQAKHPERTTQELVNEALNDLFAKYNVPTIEG
jgi:hypothetical protein